LIERQTGIQTRKRIATGRNRQRHAVEGIVPDGTRVMTFGASQLRSEETAERRRLRLQGRQRRQTSTDTGRRAMTRNRRKLLKRSHVQEGQNCRKGGALLVKSGGEDVEEFVGVLFLGRKRPSVLVKSFEHFVRVQRILQHTTSRAFSSTGCVSKWIRNSLAIAPRDGKIQPLQDSKKSLTQRTTASLRNVSTLIIAVFGQSRERDAASARRGRRAGRRVAAVRSIGVVAKPRKQRSTRSQRLQHRIEKTSIAQIDQTGAEAALPPTEFIIRGSPYYVSSDGGSGRRGGDQTKLARLNERPHRRHLRRERGKRRFKAREAAEREKPRGKGEKRRKRGRLRKRGMVFPVATWFWRQGNAK